MTNRTRTLTACGLALRDEILVKSVLQVTASRLSSAWRYVDGFDCDVALREPGTAVGADGGRSANTRAPIFVTLKRGARTSSSSLTTLHWPLRVSELVDLLNHFSAPDGRRLASNSPTLETVGEAAKTVHSPLVSALWALTQGTSGQFAYAALALGGTTIFIDLTRRIFRSKNELSPDAIGALARLTMAPCVNKISAEDWNVIDSGFQTQPLDALLWSCGMHGPASGLLPWLQGANAFALRQWPDLGRVGGKSAYVGLSARLMQRAYTVAELSRDTSLNVIEIHAFINACALCGLINKNRVETSEPRPVAAAPSGRWASIFRAVRSALGIGEGDSGSA